MDDVDAVLASPPPAVPLIKDAARGAAAKKVRRREKTTEELYGEHLPKTAEEAMRAIWHKPVEIRQHERKLFKRFMGKVRRNEQPGLGKDHSPLSNCYAWTQSKGYVIFVVWLQGGLDDVTVEVTEPQRVLVQTEGYPAVVDRDLAYAIDPSQDMDSVSWDKLDMIAFKIAKGEYGKVWDRLFAEDWRMLRAADFGAAKGCYDWAANPEDPLSFVVTVYVPEHATKKDIQVEIKADRAEVRVAGWAAPWRRSFKYPCRAFQSTWQLGWAPPEDSKAGKAPAESAPAGMAWSPDQDVGGEPDLKGRTRRCVQLTCFFVELPTKRMIYDRSPGGEITELGKQGEVEDPPPSAFAADVPDHDVAARTLFVEEEDGMLTGVVAEMIAHMDGAERYRPFESLGHVTQNMLRYIPSHERDQYAFDETDEQGDPESILRWWDRSAYKAELDWCAAAGRAPDRLLTNDPDGEIAARARRLRLDDDDDDDDAPDDGDDDGDDDEPVVAEIAEPEPALPLPPGGMLGTAPVRVRPAAAPARSSDKAWPHGVALSGDASWPAVVLSDYAFDAGAKTVKVYLSLGAALRGPLTDGAVAAEFDADAVRLEVADAASKRRLCFSSFLAHGVDAARCKAKVKAEKGEVVLVLRKADPDDAWARLSRDVNFDAGDQVGAPLPPADEGDGGYQ